jgi:GDP/UDP-N,N'-diacetylbacillosamine 2-epimerase (hydrolysing)
MVKKRKICVVTGTRAEYGLLYWTMKEILNDPDLELQVVVTGTHLSPEYGLTYQQIEKDGFTIDRKLDILLSSDKPAGISKAMGLALIGMSEILDQMNPDLVLLLGDRYEIFAIAAACTVHRIPIAHISGGESTIGAMDEAFRHSLTKMSQLHFVSTELYRKRVIQLGENPDHVFNVGHWSVDNVKQLPLLSKEAFEDSIEFKLGERNLLVTFHPVTLEHSTSEQQFKELLDALDSFQDTRLIFTKPNADTDSRIIIHMLDEYVDRNPEKAIAFTSLGQLRYLSAMQYVDAVVGNSSSGIVEVPLFGIPTINIGDRQTGRIMGESIINTVPEKEAIIAAIKLAYDPVFREKAKTAPHPYGEGGTAKKIVQVLKSVSLDNILKKPFFDLY